MQLNGGPVLVAGPFHERTTVPRQTPIVPTERWSPVSTPATEASVWKPTPTYGIEAGTMQWNEVEPALRAGFPSERRAARAACQP